ncbi:hypothetical protein SCHPADRAFT_946684 [Schizopora paradoxa]|uniref:DUF6532 domain-containing protein n=1 Tax=Schizopora paradoxa TaxID=27342 RepID=A0A0H2R1R5_9AGAM|nr:hypothetical protein SCHPADRAFT_946684 [Schizopora paradoxa]
MKALVVKNEESESESANMLAVKREPEARSSSAPRSKSQLPCGVSDGRDKRWSIIFVPTFMSYLGTLEDPWHMDQSKTMKVLQAIWDVVYHDRPHVIESASDVVFTICRQRSYEWRNKFLHHAQCHIETIIKKNDWTTKGDRENIRDFVAEMLGGTYPFIFKQPHNAKTKGPFQSEFIAYVFSSHLQFVKDAARVKRVPLTATHNPVGALTLASLACHRALEAYATGSNTFMGRFSGESMAEETTYFSKSILNLSEKTWSKIREESLKFVPAGLRRSSKAEVVVAAPVDQRPLIQDDEDSE